MRIVVLALACVACMAFAEDDKKYYIERYPGDGMKQRPKKVEERSVGKIIGMTPAESDITSTNEKPTRAARYITPSVSSKSWQPARKPQPKTRAVLMPDHEGKFPPSPAVTDKAGRVDKKPRTPSAESPEITPPATTNASPKETPVVETK